MIESIIRFAHDELHAQLDAGEWGETPSIVHDMVDNLLTAKVLSSVDVSRLPTSVAKIERILSMPFDMQDWSVIVTEGVGDAAMGLIAATCFEVEQKVNLVAIPIAIFNGQAVIAYLAHAVWNGTDAFPDIDGRDLTDVIHTLPDDMKSEVADLIWRGAVTAVLATAVAAGRAA